MNIQSKGYIIKGVNLMDQIEIDASGVITVQVGAGYRALEITPETAIHWADALRQAATLSRQIEDSMRDRT